MLDPPGLNADCTAPCSLAVARKALLQQLRVVPIANAACADNPTQVVTRPQLTIAPGDAATWYFEGHVTYDWNSPWAEVGDLVKGTVHFQTTSDDLYPNDPCAGNRDADVVFNFTVNSTPYTIAGIGSAYAWRLCEPGTYMPAFQLNTYRTGGPITGWMNLYNAVDTKDFPLVPPPLADIDALGLSQGARGFEMYTYTDNTGFFVYLDVLRPNDAQTKADCMKDGWQKYGFKNQGQCVRFIETGKDSR